MTLCGERRGLLPRIGRQASSLRVVGQVQMSETMIQHANFCDSAIGHEELREAGGKRATRGPRAPKEVVLLLCTHSPPGDGPHSGTAGEQLEPNMARMGTLIAKYWLRNPPAADFVEGRAAI